MKMKYWITPIIFLLLPFAFISPGLIWKSQLLFFMFCPVLIVAFNLKNIWIKCFLLYLTLWQLFIFVMSFNHRDFSPGHGLGMLLSVMAAALIYKAITESPISDERWASVIRIAVIVQILISLPQAWGWNPVMGILGLFTTVVEKLPGHLVGSLGNRNFLAAFIAMSVPFFIGWRTFKIGRVKFNPGLTVIFAFLLACFSPGTVAAMVGIGFYLTYRYSWKKRLIAWSLISKVCILYIAAYVLTTGNHLWEFQDLPGQLREFWETGKVTIYSKSPDGTDVGRFGMWMIAISQLLKSWSFMVFGYGPAAAWGQKYPLHGEYISVWFQYGLIGLGLMLGYIAQTFRYLVKADHLVYLTAFLIICLDMVGNFSAEVATTACMMVVICGLIERKRLNG